MSEMNSTPSDPAKPAVRKVKDLTALKFTLAIFALIPLMAFVFLPWIGVLDKTGNRFIGLSGYIFLWNSANSWLLLSIPFAALFGVYAGLKSMKRGTRAVLLLIQIALTALGLWSMYQNLSKFERGYSAKVQLVWLGEQFNYLKAAGGRIWSSGLSYGVWVVVGGLAGIILLSLLFLLLDKKKKKPQPKPVA